jgi:hypothetical protein
MSYWTICRTAIKKKRVPMQAESRRTGSPMDLDETFLLSCKPAVEIFGLSIREDS